MHGIIPLLAPLEGRTLRRHLLRLVLGSVLPVLAFAALLLWRVGEAERSGLEADLRQRAETVLAALDRELTVTITTARLLAAALPPEDDLGDFHALATRTLRVLGSGNVTVRDSQSRQLLNTNIAWGAPLPTTTSLARADAEAARTGGAVVADLVRGVIDGLPYVAVVVPISRSRESWFLSLAHPPADLVQRLAAIPRDSAETVLVRDGTGRIVAQLGGGTALPGDAAAAALASTHLVAERRSGVGDWRVTVALPRAAAAQPGQRALWLLGLGGVVALGVGLALAGTVARRLRRALDALDAAGRAVVADTPLPKPATPLREANQAIAALAEVNQRRNAEISARQLGEERLRIALLDAPILACSWDRELRYTWLADPQGDLPPLDVIGRTDAELLPPELAAQAQEMAAFKQAVLDTGERQRRTVRWRRRDGVLHTFDLIGEPLREGDRITGGVLAAHDVTRHLEAAEERSRLATDLSTEQARLAAVFQAVPIGLVMAEAPTGRIVAGNAFAVELFGHPIRHSATIADYAEWKALHSDGRPVQPHEYPAARVLQAGMERAELEILYCRPDGKDRWLRLIAAPVRSGDEALLGAVVAVVDVDRERRDAAALRANETRSRLLINELNHRVKNTLATVQAIAAQSLARAESVEEVRERLGGRIFALAAAHDLLNRTAWSPAPLRETLEAALAPVRPAGHDRIRLEGPPVALPPRGVLALSLAVHELALNAVHHGALSVEAGWVRLSWDAPTDDVLHLRWEERDGPRVAPPERRGFGSRLIERGLAHELGGKAALTFAPEGLRCDIALPLERGREAA